MYPMPDPTELQKIVIQKQMERYSRAEDALFSPPRIAGVALVSTFAYPVRPGNYLSMIFLGLLFFGFAVYTLAIRTALPFCPRRA